MTSSWETGRTKGKVHVMLRVGRDPQLLLQIAVLFSFSISRAMDSLEGTLRPDVRLAITHEVIEPLERARRVFGHAIARYGMCPERLVVPADTVSLAQMQLRALCVAARRTDFHWELLPEPLRDPFAVDRRFSRALGRSVPGYLPADRSAPL